VNSPRRALTLKGLRVVDDRQAGEAERFVKAASRCMEVVATGSDVNYRHGHRPHPVQYVLADRPSDAVALPLGSNGNQFIRPPSPVTCHPA
jgi:hypothetical protein